MTIQQWWRGRGPVLAGAAGVLAALAVVGLPTSAAASCATAPKPSPFRFVGLVMQTQDDGRVAFVSRKGVSGLVEVDGSPAVRTSSHTDLDRTYLLYATYEFDPVNATAPYQDNLCTATRMTEGPKATGGLPAPPPESGPSWGWIGGGIGAGAAVLTGGALLVVRRRR